MKKPYQKKRFIAKIYVKLFSKYSKKCINLWSIELFTTTCPNMFNYSKKKTAVQKKLKTKKT